MIFHDNFFGKITMEIIVHISFWGLLNNDSGFRKLLCIYWVDFISNYRYKIKSLLNFYDFPFNILNTFKFSDIQGLVKHDLTLPDLSGCSMTWTILGFIGLKKRALHQNEKSLHIIQLSLHHDTEPVDNQISKGKAGHFSVIWWICNENITVKRVGIQQKPVRYLNIKIFYKDNMHIYKIMYIASETVFNIILEMVYRVTKTDVLF